MPEYEDGFEIVYYSGHKYYKCNQYWSTGHKCAFESFDKEEIIAHAGDPHSETGRRVKRQTRTVVSPILGKDGEQIVREQDINEARFKEG
jgi:hypothetical protein